MYKQSVFTVWRNSYVVVVVVIVVRSSSPCYSRSSHQCDLPVVVVCCQTISYKCILADHLNEERRLSTLILHCSIPLIFADQAREREFYLANFRIPSMHSIFNWCSLFIAWLILFFMIRYVIQIKLQKRPRCYLEWSAVGLQQTSHTCV